jgi:phage gp36-like protein
VAYATLDQMTDRFGLRMLVALTDRGVVASETVDTGTVARALADTDALIDGYLKVRYVLPLATVPALLVDLALSIAIYKLHTASPDDKIVRDYDQAMRMLREIAQGVIQLDVAGAEPAISGGSGARMTDRERPLTAENLKGFI